MKLRKITSSKVPVTAAENESAFDDIVSNIKDDFDYIVEGLETLNRRGTDSSKQAMSIAATISSELEGYIANIAESITK